MNDGMPWRRLERLEPSDQKLLSFAARSLRDHLFRYPDDARGVLLSRTKDPISDLLLVLGVRRNERRAVTRAVQELIDDGFLVVDGSTIRIKNFAVHQGNCAPTVQQPSSSEGRQERPRTAESARKAAYRQRRRTEQAGQMSTDKPGTNVPMSQDGQNGTCPGQDCPVEQSREEQRREDTAAPVGTCPTGHGTRDTGQDMSQPGTTDDDRRVPCPPDLCLLDGQIANLEMAGVPRWAIDQMTRDLVGKFIVDKPRPLSAWLKCLSKAIAGEWNAGRRPKKLDPNALPPRSERSWMTAEEAGLPS